MRYGRFETIKIRDIMDETPVYHEEGLKIYSLGVDLINKDERTRNNTLLYIDFTGIERTSFAFLNACIGKWYMDGIGDIKHINANDIVEAKIKAVIENVVANKPCMFCGGTGKQSGRPKNPSLDKNKQDN